MLGSKNSLASYLRKKCDSIVFNKEACEQICNDAYEQHNIATGTMMDLIADRTVLKDASDFLLFVLTREIDKIDKTDITSEFFTEIEIKGYSKQKVEEENVFPIKIKCIKVTTDQYIGATNTDFLLSLRKAQLINYNENAQRTMQRVVRGENTYYKITLNAKAVKAIENSLDTNTFIPNTITLNIPEDVSSEYYYDEDSSTLVINSLEHFDISDGYHRLIAIYREKDRNPDFTYPVELRIVTFSDDKVKQFIFQEDQKTKMSKVDSNSMNMSNQANIVTERLSRDTDFDFVGKIQRNGGQINFGDLATLIDYFYFKDNKGKKNFLDTKSIIVAKNEVKEGLNAYAELDVANLDKQYSFEDLAIILYGIKNKKSATDINSAIQKKSTLDGRMFRFRIPRKKMVDSVATLYQ